MRPESRTSRWLPFVTFFAGVVITASAGVVLDPARGQERSPSRPSAPPDPSLPDEVPEPKPANVPDQEGADAAEVPNASGVELLMLGWSGEIEEVITLPTPKELARERLVLASRALEQELHRFMKPAMSGGASWYAERTGPFLEWSRRHIQARLDLADTDEERIAALRSEIAHTRALLPTLQQRAQGGSPGEWDWIFEFDHYRLELETRLAELTRE